MRGLSLAVIAAAACSDAKGLTLKVFPASGESQVLVMISDRPCSASDPKANPDGSDACTGGIAGFPMGSPRLHGTVRFLSDGAASDFTNETQIPADTLLDITSDGVPLRLLPDPMAGSNSTEVLLLGLGGGSAVSFARLHIPTVPTSSTYEQVTLAPLAGSATAHLWQGPTKRYSCVRFVESGSAEFFVPTGDPDCDEVMLDRECQPYVYDFTGTTTTAPDLDDATCTLPFITSQNLDLCVLGQDDETCTDNVTFGSAVTATCTNHFGSSAPCVPASMCTTPSCEGLGATCFGSSFASLDEQGIGTAHIDCTVGYGSGLATDPCPGVFSIPGLSGSSGCTLAIETPVPGLIDTDVNTSIGFGSAAKFVDGNFMTPDALVSLQAGSSDPSTACTYSIIPPPTNSMTFDINKEQLTLGYLLIKGPTPTSVPMRGLVLPVLLRYPTPNVTDLMGCGSDVAGSINETVCSLTGSAGDISLSACILTD